MVYGTKNSEWNGIHIDYVSRSPAKKEASSTERETNQKKGLEGESRRKMTIPTGSDTPISVYMILYYVRMSICLWKFENKKKKAKLGKISRRSLTE